MNQPEARFIFDWRKSHWDYRLPVLIAISFFAHIFCFYIFRVVYPPTTSLLPPSAQVTVLDPNRSQDKNLLEWVAMNNPANVSAPTFDTRLITQVVPPYKPIYSTLSVELKRADSAKPQDQGIPSLVLGRDAFADALTTAGRVRDEVVSYPIGNRIDTSTACPSVLVGVAGQFSFVRANIDLRGRRPRGRSGLCLSNAIERQRTA